MRNRGVRIALVGLVLLVQAGAAWQVWVVERERTARQLAMHKFGADARSLLAAIANLRAAHQAYVADGQDARAWFGKATTIVDGLRTALAETRGLATSPAALQSLDAAAEQVAAFTKTDGQARSLITSDQRLMASDLIFGDGAESLAACAARVDDAIARETDALGQRLGRARTIEIAALGAAAAAGIIGLLLLLPGGGARPQPDTLSIANASRAAPSQAPQPRAAAPPGPDLRPVAALCGEFSRIGDPGALPPLVERVASILNASGLIVWMANPATGALHPVLSHGYTEPALARIGELGPNEDNATAEAFRTAALRVVKASGGTFGALAVPLVTPAGCVGVMAAEIRDGGETNAATQAIAAIIAAQLASLASASPASQQ